MEQIQQAAAAHGLEPKELCDQNCQTFKVPKTIILLFRNVFISNIFKDLSEKANISHDHFIRTTDAEHRDAVQYFWVCLAMGDPGMVFANNVRKC